MAINYKVTASSLNIRDKAGTDGTVLGSYSKGTKVSISNKPSLLYNKVWLKLDKPYLGKTAYIHKDYAEEIKNKSVKDEDPKGTEEAFSSKAVLVTTEFIYKISNTLDSKGISTSTTKSLKKGDKVTITKKSSTGFYYINSSNPAGIAGWIHIHAVNLADKDGKLSTKISKDKVEVVEAINKSVNEYTSSLKHVKEISLTAANYEALIANQADSVKGANKILYKNLNGIHGVPYQFMDTVDRRTDPKNSIGRRYAERIVSKMPLLLLTPGRPDFLPSFNKTERNHIKDALINGLGKLGGNLETILTTSGRYYTFKFDYAEYYKYVNSLLRMCAIYLGVHKRQHGNGYGKGYHKALGSFEWQKALNRELRGFISTKEFVAFYVDSATSVSEDFSTDTTTSKLLPSLNSGVSDMAREVQFLAGPISGLQVEALDPENFEASMKDIKKISTRYLNNNRLFNNIAEQFATVGKGGKIAFPEIWDDTTFSKSYSVSIKLRTPDADKLSWYLNICVPLMHLLGFGAARQLGPNGYRSPFLVRGYYKGMFNIDMGIITSMSISKGKEGSWTLDGLPTEVDVDITIKDLYSLLTISKTSDTGILNFLNNTSLMDYLANTCGININKPEIERTLETYILLGKNSIQDIYGNNWMKLQNAMSNLAATAYGKFSSK